MADPKYSGPDAGGTPANDGDLHDTGGNPYASGRPGDATLSSDYRTAAPLGYWSNPPTDSSNPWRDGAGAFDDPRSKNLTSDVEASLGAVYGEVYANMHDATATTSSADPSAILDDSGFGKDGTGRSQEGTSGVTGYAPYINGGYNMGTPLDAFDFAQAVAPGMSESTYVAQLNKAIAYWQNVAATSTDGNRVSRANTSVGWLQTELGKVQTPSPNTFHLVYPV